MLDANSVEQLKKGIRLQISEDRALLDQLRAEVRPLRDRVRRIQPHSTTSVAVVGTDGGNNKVQFDPFLVQLVRVVDSSNNEYCMEVVSPTSDVDRLAAAQFNGDGSPKTALGRLMSFLGVSDLPRLSHMIRKSEKNQPASSSWVQVYREVVEWAILFDILRSKEFATDTIFICDGLLRSKVFAGELFRKMLDGMKSSIENAAKRSKRKVFLTGVSKSSRVLDRYRLAMALEHILKTDYPAYVEVPRDMEANAYVWPEWARGADAAVAGGEAAKFVGGKMFFVKFGSRPNDPIWPVDIFEHQVSDAQSILGRMLGDALVGFPVPFYPQCLQKAHENAALVDFDFDILQDEIFRGIRDALGNQGQALDMFRLQDTDVSQRRYT